MEPEVYRKMKSGFDRAFIAVIEYRMILREAGIEEKALKTKASNLRWKLNRKKESEGARENGFTFEQIRRRKIRGGSSK